MQSVTGRDLIIVQNPDSNDLFYKPFWFGRHMYFANIDSGTLYSQTPIYLGNREYATIPDLINYFQSNNVKIINEGYYYVKVM